MQDQTTAALPVVSFTGEMKSALDRISESSHVARIQSEQYTLGKQGVALNDVMVDLQKSSVSLAMGVQVRNKLVSAYQEMMNMQV